MGNVLRVEEACETSRCHSARQMSTLEIRVVLLLRFYSDDNFLGIFEMEVV